MHIMRFRHDAESAIFDRVAHRTRSRGFLVCGAVAPVLFSTVYLVDGAFREGYRSWHHTISTLSLGSSGWIQIANFMVTGALTVGFAVGIKRGLGSGPGSVAGPVLFGLAGTGLIVIGAFVTDPVLGFPSATPAAPSLHATVHNLGSLLVFVALPSACFALARSPVCAGWRAWTPYSIGTGVCALGSFALFFATVAAADGQGGASSPAGLFERLPVLLLGGWQTLFALRLWKALA